MSFLFDTLTDLTVLKTPAFRGIGEILLVKHKLETVDLMFDHVNKVTSSLPELQMI